MAFIFELGYIAAHRYIPRYIEALAERNGLDITLVETDEKIALIADEKEPKLADFLNQLGDLLPASLFMGASEHRIEAMPVPKIRKCERPSVPHAVALCPTCMKEIFDPSSRRYYYPFTSCNCCGAQYGLAEGYPFERKTTQMRFFVPCEACEAEMRSNPFRKDYALISCHNCGVPVKMTDRIKERYANDSGSFKTMFEVAAKAIRDGKTVRIKTLMGDRLFFDAKSENDFHGKRLMLLDAGRIEEFCAVIKDEIHALLSIERPLLDVTVSDETLWSFYGRVATIKYPDDGFTVLLAKELIALGFGCVGYVECGSDAPADYVIDYDLQVDAQRDMRYFINKDSKFIVEGERVSFPVWFERHTARVAVAHGLAAVPFEKGVLLERMERIESAEAAELFVLENEPFASEHSRTVRFDQASASVISVLLEHRKTDKKAVGVYFEDLLLFLYHNGKKPIIAVPSLEFRPEELREKIVTLREGSDRLVVNFETKYPDRAERLFSREGPGLLFEAAAVIMGFEDPGFDAVGKAALTFVGKGGLQIDTRVSDNRFDPFAFLASIMSYTMAEVPTALLAYSIFESFGDYVTEVAMELKRRAKAEHIVLCGRTFGHQSLFSRIQRNFANEEVLMNRLFPVGKENAVFGALGL
ncbi:carbamoyltransferase HypF [Hydrogenimonas cancrithermarum]|uniref:Zinc finger HypF-type domain-containing protein n=1 Tax=Hydrogenimonas cancrithermarum TaxID=2993563 RepID=A0ABN6WUT5_9BACT|nr:hypothetical protein [Hydrogenimonas cancrithermarum]BDY12494.1 hypothetical protein HCR_08060 [Hydrogenimonas cancrithermarum]